MLLTLVISLLSGQVIYEWIDSKGESHFTNDASSIPPKAKRRVTTGAELVVVPAKADAGSGVDAGAGSADAGQPAVSAKPDGGVPAPDLCARASQLVSQLEREAEQAKTRQQQDDERENQRCQEALRLQGDFGYARCMSSRAPRVAPGNAAALKLDEAREALRRAQVGGCR